MPHSLHSARFTPKLFFNFNFHSSIFIEVQLLYNTLLVSAEQQSESATHIDIPSLSRISFPFGSPQRTE